MVITTLLPKFEPLEIVAGIEILCSGPFFFAALAVVSDWSKARFLNRPVDWSGSIKEGLQIGLLVDAFMAVLLGLIFSIAPVTHWLERKSGQNHLLLTAGAVAFAVALFILRKKHRIVYGALEISAAVAGMIVYPVAPSSAAEGLSIQSTAWALGLLSFVYILVRGLDNVDVGRTERLKFMAAQKTGVLGGIKDTKDA